MGTTTRKAPRSKNTPNPHYKPPGNILQKLNTFVHLDVITPFVFFAFWGVMLVVVSPVLAAFFLPLTLLYQLGMALVNKLGPPKSLKSEFAVVITGCDTGFGNLLTMAMAEQHHEKYCIFATCVTEKGIKGLAKQIQAMETQGHSVIVSQLDVTDQESVDELAELVDEWLAEDLSTRTFHALVNNAGVGSGGEIDWCEMNSFEWDMSVNYFGMIRVTKAFLPILKEQAVANETNGYYARIVNITSMAGLSCGPSMCAYSGSKHAAEAFSNTLRLEMSSWNIKVVTCNPSFHKTPIVGGIAPTLDKVFKNMDREVYDQYGKTYLEETKTIAIAMSSQTEWDASNVTTALIKAIVQPHPPAQMLVGLDAKFAIAGMRHLPIWAQSFFMRSGIKSLRSCNVAAMEKSGKQR